MSRVNCHLCANSQVSFNEIEFSLHFKFHLINEINTWDDYLKKNSGEI